ncbi:hypothetical protein DYB28_009290 [Aphanomyces astaci]|uniref:Uncharacterized protein n=1 Tax=Aphanomyces astaci TaxID=112090 RepID=A0A397DCC2_APHAT|nr:hypothetical protein DYB36_010862 [Aphanomyces astaci]RHY61995.1 hypothetical protein DYB30_001841 [Aphanomyces astaci]RHZ15518.1 hypothetical protein DYB31_006876 [Aphanomyces astaci]RLN88024.1 hypothetical protein DYB28_009290 [Aphanomyces astaci]
MSSTLPFDKEAYLERIGLPTDPVELGSENSLAFLTKVVVHHHLAIPFENLAACGVFPVDRGHVQDSAVERISLDADKIFQKLVTDKRGGYCFEQNALLAAALRAFGFTVDTLAARVVIPFQSDASAGLRLTGFGGRGQPPSPLPLNEDHVVETKGGEKYQLKRVHLERHASPSTYSGDFLLVATAPPAASTFWGVYYKTQQAGDFHASYVFSTENLMAHADYIPANWYVSTSPHSRFTQAATCAKRTEAGLLSLLGMTFNHIEYGQVVESKTLTSTAEVLNVLEDRFGLVPPSPQ